MPPFYSDKNWGGHGRPSRPCCAGPELSSFIVCWEWILNPHLSNNCLYLKHGAERLFSCTCLMLWSNLFVRSFATWPHEPMLALLMSNKDSMHGTNALCRKMKFSSALVYSYASGSLIMLACRHVCSCMDVLYVKARVCCEKHNWNIRLLCCGTSGGRSHSAVCSIFITESAL